MLRCISFNMWIVLLFQFENIPYDWFIFNPFGQFRFPYFRTLGDGAVSASKAWDINDVNRKNKLYILWEKKYDNTGKGHNESEKNILTKNLLECQIFDRRFIIRPLNKKDSVLVYTTYIQCSWAVQVKKKQNLLWARQS